VSVNDIGTEIDQCAPKPTERADDGPEPSHTLIDLDMPDSMCAKKVGQRAVLAYKRNAMARGCLLACKVHRHVHDPVADFITVWRGMNDSHQLPLY